jgi:hypothetical protein
MLLPPWSQVGTIESALQYRHIFRTVICLVVQTNSQPCCTLVSFIATTCLSLQDISLGPSKHVVTSNVKTHDNDFDKKDFHRMFSAYNGHKVFGKYTCVEIITGWIIQQLRIALL